MGKLRDILRWPRRYRTSRGFGVHSPFAYDFITKVLRERDASYYSYAEIDSLCARAHRGMTLPNMNFTATSFDRQEARMLFRVLCRFNPKEVIEIGGSNEVTRTIIERAVPHTKISRWSRDSHPKLDNGNTYFILVNYAIDINSSIMRKYMLEAVNNPNGVVIFFRNLQLPVLKRIWSEIAAVASFGMTFHDDLTAIYCAFPNLPRQDYELLL